MQKIELQSPIAVANFIIEVAKKEGNPVTNLKLQKVLFFLQGYCLNEYNRILFDGKFASGNMALLKKKYIRYLNLRDPCLLIF